MKRIEKILRYPLPDQLKAVLEKFDGEFDASHLRKLYSLADSHGFTRYERFMLQRAYNRAKRDLVLNEAMELVLNLQPRREIVIKPKGTVTGTAIGQQSMYQQQMNAVVNDEFNKALRNVLLGTSP